MNAKFETYYMGVHITLNFRAGFGINGTKVGQLITANQFVQDAIEHDPRFGSVFDLRRTFEDHAEEPAVDNYELRQIAPQKKQQKSNAEIFAENKAKREAAEAKAKSAPKAPAKPKTEAKPKQNAKPEPEKVDSVKNVNDAISFFADRGDLLKDPADIPSLCQKHNVEFPNLQ